MKVFGNELDLFTCDDLSDHIERLSLRVAEIALKLLKVMSSRYRSKVSFGEFYSYLHI